MNDKDYFNEVLKLKRGKSGNSIYDFVEYEHAYLKLKKKNTTIPLRNVGPEENIKDIKKLIPTNASVFVYEIGNSGVPVPVPALKNGKLLVCNYEELVFNTIDDYYRNSGKHYVRLNELNKKNLSYMRFYYINYNDLETLISGAEPLKKFKYDGLNLSINDVGNESVVSNNDVVDILVHYYDDLGISNIHASTRSFLKEKLDGKEYEFSLALTIGRGNGDDNWANLNVVIGSNWDEKNSQMQSVCFSYSFQGSGSLASITTNSVSNVKNLITTKEDNDKIIAFLEKYPELVKAAEDQNFQNDISGALHAMKSKKWMYELALNDFSKVFGFNPEKQNLDYQRIWEGFVEVLNNKRAPIDVLAYKNK